LENFNVRCVILGGGVAGLAIARRLVETSEDIYLLEINKMNGSGFSPPLAVLNQNLGDCDSKSVLTASLIRAFLPNNSMRLVLLRNHALLAIAMTPLTKDTTMMIDGMPFILLDPTGPAQMKLGEVSKSTKQAIASQQYTLEVIPPAAARQQ